MPLDIHSSLPLPDGGTIPVLGFGVFQIPAGGATRRAVAEALKVGYRHIDTAKIYGNEADVGEAVRASGLGRAEVFITTKVWNGDQGYDSTLTACDESLSKLSTSFIDLYLIHWPVGPVRKATWRALEKLRAEGKCRAIGVSNFTAGHLDDLKSSSATTPAVDQVEFSPFLYQRALLAACRSRGIVVEAYSPLAKAKKLADPRLWAVARKHGRTPAQVMLRWGLEHGLVVLPRSSRREHIEENARLFDFELDGADMETMDALDEGYRTAWDPTAMP
jgi:diketogulonate reductase-like aldo/keto reductase